MVQDIVVGCDQIHSRGQAQLAQVLVENSHALAATIPPGLRQHLRRTIDRKHRDAPVPGEIAREKTRAATEVCGGAEADTILALKSLESATNPPEESCTKCIVVV